MPPSKVKIERISGDRTRQNTFHKRKLGLIKKAIELTVLCDCECTIILRSGPTVTCQEGRLSAYCNKDLEKMLRDCLAELPMDHYTNAEYARFTKESKEEEHEDGTTSSMAAIEVDVEAGTHTHPQLEHRVCNGEQVTQSVGGYVKPDPDAQHTNPVLYPQQSEQQKLQFPNAHPSQSWSSVEQLASSATGESSATPKGSVRKRPPPPINFGGQFANYGGEPAQKKQHGLLPPHQGHQVHNPHLVIAQGVDCTEAARDLRRAMHFQQQELQQMQTPMKEGYQDQSSDRAHSSSSLSGTNHQLPAHHPSSMMHGFFSALDQQPGSEERQHVGARKEGNLDIAAGSFVGSDFTGPDLPVTPTNFDLASIFPTTPSQHQLPISPSKGLTTPSMSQFGTQQQQQQQVTANPLFPFGQFRQ